MNLGSSVPNKIPVSHLLPRLSEYLEERGENIARCRGLERLVQNAIFWSYDRAVGSMNSAAVAACTIWRQSTFQCAWQDRYTPPFVKSYWKLMAMGRRSISFVQGGGLHRLSLVQWVAMHMQSALAGLDAGAVFCLAYFFPVTICLFLGLSSCYHVCELLKLFLLPSVKESFVSKVVFLYQVPQR